MYAAYASARPPTSGGYPPASLICSGLGPARARDAGPGRAAPGRAAPGAVRDLPARLRPDRGLARRPRAGGDGPARRAGRHRPDPPGLRARRAAAGPVHALDGPAAPRGPGAPLTPAAP